MAKGQPTVLTDIEVETVGLVESGMVGKTFFLVKSEKGEDNMAENEHPETEQVEVSEGLLEKLKGLFATKEEVEEAVSKAAETEDKDKVEKEEPSPDPLERIAALEKAYQAQMEALTKANTDLVAKVQETEAKLTKAEEVANTEREKREEREFVEKANEFVALPTNRAELGKYLYTLSKSLDKETYEGVFELLKAADRQAFQAGIFNELGSSATTEEKELVEKVQKSVDEGTNPKDALMKLSPEEQAELLAQIPYEEGSKR